MTSPEIPKHHQSPESFLTFDDIASHLAQLDEKMAPAYGTLDDAIEAHPEILDQAVNLLADKLVTQEAEPPLSDTEVELLRFETIHSLLDEPTQQQLAPSMAIIKAGIKERAELEPRAATLGEEKYNEAKEDLIQKVNWKVAVDKEVGREHEHPVSSLLPKLGHTPTSDWAVGRFSNEIRSIEQLEEDLKEQGLLRDTLEAPITPEQSLDPDLTETIRQWHILTTDTFEYLSNSRRLAAHNALPNRELIKLAELRHACKKLSDLDLKATALLSAIQNKTYEVFDAYDKVDLDRLSAELNERPNARFIGNQRLLRETTTIEDVPAWVNDRLSEFPDWYSKGIGFINFSDDQQATRVDTEGEEWSTSGNMSSFDNKLTVNTEFNRYKDLLTKHTFPDTVVRKFIESEITTTFDHELTHYAHQSRIPIAWLREWVRVTREEPAHVTPYVESVSKTDHPKHFHHKGEDLAESTALFMSHPVELLLKAPERFLALNKRDGRYPEEAVSSLMRSLSTKNRLDDVATRTRTESDQLLSMRNRRQRD